MISTARIAAGTVLFRIPHALALSPHTTDIAPVIAAAKLSGWNACALAIMRELSRGAESPWAPYLRVLPRSFTLPVFWPLAARSGKNLKHHKYASASDASLSALSPALSFPDLEQPFAGTGVLERAKAAHSEWETQFKKHVRPFLLKHAALFAPAQQSLSAYQRAIAIISSYSFTDADRAHCAASDAAVAATAATAAAAAATVADNAATTPPSTTGGAVAIAAKSLTAHQRPADSNGSGDEDEEDDEDDDDDGDSHLQGVTILAPFADILNHNSALNNARLLMNAVDAFHMVTTRDVESGEQIYNTYGEHSSTELLLKYGFVVGGEHATVCDDLRFSLSNGLDRLAMSAFDKYASDARERLEFMDEVGIMHLPADSDKVDAQPDFDDGDFVVRTGGAAPPAMVLTLALLLCARATIAEAESMVMGDEHSDDDKDQSGKGSGADHTVVAAASDAVTTEHNANSEHIAANISANDSDSDSDDDFNEDDVDDDDDDGVSARDLLAMIRDREPAALVRAWRVLKMAAEARALELGIGDGDTDASDGALELDSCRALQRLGGEVSLHQSIMATRAWLAHCAAAVHASQRRVVRALLVTIQGELDALSAAGVSTSKKRKDGALAPPPSAKKSGGSSSKKK